jgi:nucleoside-diphosphate-sugar epimerase
MDHSEKEVRFGFINYFIDLALRDEEIRIFGSGDQTRSVLYAGDAADVLYRAAQSPELIGEVYFATHDEHLSVVVEESLTLTGPMSGDE